MKNNTTQNKQDIEEEIQKLEEEKENLENNNNEEEYKDSLNESQEPYKIGYLEFYAGDIMKECDPVAFNCSLNDYNDSRITDINDEIEQLKEDLKDCLENE
jgi:ATP-dependent Clp protease ATP-binding subunit ClpA